MKTALELLNELHKDIKGCAREYYRTKVVKYRCAEADESREECGVFFNSTKGHCLHSVSHEHRDSCDTPKRCRTKPCVELKKINIDLTQVPT